MLQGSCCIPPRIALHGAVRCTVCEHIASTFVVSLVITSVTVDLLMFMRVRSYIILSKTLQSESVGKWHGQFILTPDTTYVVQAGCAAVCLIKGHSWRHALPLSRTAHQRLCRELRMFRRWHTKKSERQVMHGPQHKQH